MGRRGDTSADDATPILKELLWPRLTMENRDNTLERPARDGRRKKPFGLVPVFESIRQTRAGRGRIEPPKGSLGERLLYALQWDADTRLYGVVDAAQDVELALTARLMGHRIHTLFSGDLALSLAHVGPCLVELRDPCAYVGKWTESIGMSAGILLETSADLQTLGKHLRTIFVVTDEEAQEYFFRFYDPRVLRAFLPTCTANELREFFGPVTRWIVENDRGTAYEQYRVDGGQLAAREIA
jgi:Domain of unknown function (DUF4123)